MKVATKVVMKNALERGAAHASAPEVKANIHVHKRAPNAVLVKIAWIVKIPAKARAKHA